MNKTLLFNNPIETGLRSLVILHEAYPESLDLQKLLYFDYMVVHSGDLPSAPESLHPSVPNRSGELLVRRNTIEQGLEFYMRKQLIKKIFNERGIEYTIEDNATIFLDMLEETYYLELREKVKWVIETYKNWEISQLEQFIKTNLDKWGGEFIYCTLEGVE